MAMTAGPSTGLVGDIPMVDINTTPLIDVLLVLLIMFVITAPQLTHRVAITLPQQTGGDLISPRFENRLLALRDQAGAIEFRLDGELISETMLFTEFRAVGAKRKSEQTRYRIEVDESVPYAVLASVLASAKRSHLEPITFENRAWPSVADDAERVPRP